MLPAGATGFDRHMPDQPAGPAGSHGKSGETLTPANAAFAAGLRHSGQSGIDGKLRCYEATVVILKECEQPRIFT